MGLSVAGGLALIGAGKMGQAMVRGWLAAGLAPGSLMVQEPNPDPALVDLAKEAGFAILDRLADGARPGVMVLAVKPQVLDAVSASLTHAVTSETLILSIAAGKTLATLAKPFAAAPLAIIRAMPNTPAAIGQGITVACANAHVTDRQRALATALLSAIGQVAWIDDERHMDAVTAVSGSGPAYVFLLTEALTKAGIAQGLPADLAAQLARATVAGSGALLASRSQDPADLRRAVTSPGGTTQAALDILMRDGSGLEALLADAVAAATARSRALAG